MQTLRGMKDPAGLVDVVYEAVLDGPKGRKRFLGIDPESVDLERWKRKPNEIRIRIET